MGYFRMADCNDGFTRASSIAISVSMVKLCVPRIHLLISDSFFPRRSARSFCFRPFSCSLPNIPLSFLQRQIAVVIATQKVFKETVVFFDFSVYICFDIHSYIVQQKIQAKGLSVRMVLLGFTYVSNLLYVSDLTSIYDTSNKTIAT